MTIQQKRAGRTPDADWLAALARSGRATSLAALLLPLAGGMLLPVQALTLAHILHRAIADGVAAEALGGPVLLLAALFGMRVLLGFGADWAATEASEAAKLRLRRALGATLLGQLPIWTQARPSGALAATLLEQTEALDGYLGRYLPALWQATILPIAFAAMIVPVDWVVALLFIVTAPLIPVFMALAGWGAEAASARQAKALSRLTGYFADRLRGLATLKLLGREAAEAAGVARASEDLRVRTMRVLRIAFLSSAVLEFFAALGVAGVALYVGLTFLGLVGLRGGAVLTLEAGLFCLLMAPEIYAPLRLLAAHYHDRAAARAAMGEIGALLGTLPDLAPQAGTDAALPIDATPPDVALAALTVATPAGRLVIGDLDLSVAPGEHVAIMGASGSGKSTLLEAVAGLRPHAGRILLDDSEAAPAALRARIALLGQRPAIFAGSIADNIRLGAPHADEAEIADAARRAGVMEFAAALPDGLDTLLGENGLGLSGGEIQRVALARLYLRPAGLLLLDEPTAHLDAGTEALVLDGLVDFARGRTMLVVTHSPAVAARLHRCLTLENGMLAETAGGA